MDLQDRKDELDNIVLAIDELMCKIKDKNYIEQFELIKYEAIICKYCGNNIEEYKIELNNNLEAEKQKFNEKMDNFEQMIIIEKHKYQQMNSDEKYEYSKNYITQFNNAIGGSEKKYFAKILYELGFGYYQKFI